MDDDDDHYEYEDDSSSSFYAESTSGFHVASTAIIMVSPPETPEEDDEKDPSKNNRASQEVFQTPPEDSHPQTSEGQTPLPEVDLSATSSVDDNEDDDHPYEEVGDERGMIVAVGNCGTDGDGAGVVDLGRDTDLGFAEAEATEFRVSRRNGGLSESPLKKLRVSEEDLGKSEAQGVESLEMDRGDVKSSEEGPESESELEKVDATESDSETEMVESGSESEESSEPEMERRALPRTVGGGRTTVDGEEEVQKEVVILDVLKLLKEKYGGDGDGEDEEIDNCSFWEISKRRGMTFRRPLWWPEGGF